MIYINHCYITAPVLIYLHVTLTLSSEGWVGNYQVYQQTVTGMKVSMCNGPEMERWKEDPRSWRKGKESMSWRESERESSVSSGGWSTACRGPYPTVRVTILNSQCSCLVEKRREEDEGESRKRNRTVLVLQTGKEGGTDWVTVGNGRNSVWGKETSQWLSWYHG